MGYVEDHILLKMGLIVLLFIFVLIILSLMLQSFKVLRRVQKQEAAERRNSPVSHKTHPKLPKTKHDKNHL